MYHLAPRFGAFRHVLFSLMVVAALGLRAEVATHRATAKYAQIPLAFEPSGEQEFRVHSPGSELRISASEIALSPDLRLRLVHARRDAKGQPLDKLPGVVNYLR